MYSHVTADCRGTRCEQGTQWSIRGGTSAASTQSHASYPTDRTRISMSIQGMHFYQLREDEAIPSSRPSMSGESPRGMQNLQTYLDAAPNPRTKMQRQQMPDPAVYCNPRKDAPAAEATTGNGRPSSSGNESSYATRNRHLVEADEEQTKSSHTLLIFSFCCSAQILDRIQRKVIVERQQGGNTQKSVLISYDPSRHHNFFISGGKLQGDHVTDQRQTTTSQPEPYNSTVIVA
jgi:hypothetical protein